MLLTNMWKLEIKNQKPCNYSDCLAAVPLFLIITYDKINIGFLIYGK